MANSYGFHDLFWFSPSEDVKVIDSDSGEELTTHTLSKLKDTIDLGIQQFVSIKPVFSHIQRGRADGDQTFAVPATGQYILYNEYIDNSGYYSSPSVTSDFTTQKTPICQTSFSHSRSQGGNVRTYNIKIAVFNFEAGDEVTFTNSESATGIQYGTQSHIAFRVLKGSISNIETISGGSGENTIMQDTSRGDSYNRTSIPAGKYLAISVYSQGYGSSATNSDLVVLSGNVNSYEKIFPESPNGPDTFGLIEFDTTGSITFIWNGATSYVGRGYLLLKLTIDES